ncbi:hypothetical protein JQC91_09415 [Jannaschia sp. Os4]|uniref:hypothetical protein n=1 Tax=Jannaschia sp. Os4 TaxID=2807617 RepID=UPI00193A963A|nr:hypothetical protein [Jannaschia sp. Os4]MBM2576526.1 hypothetical protein [Jannaschia sp. Os4]
MTEAKGTIPSGGAEIVTIGLRDTERGSVVHRLFGAVCGGASAAEIGDLTADRLRRVPAVVTPAVARGHDAVEVAKRLRRARFAGRLVVVVEDCPDEEVLRRDVVDAAPDLAVDVVPLGRPPRLMAG